MNESYPPRCQWCLAHPLLTDYHDAEWGVPRTADREQFEHLVFEVFQAGLSWLTILKKRDAFRNAFAGFDPAVVATWGEKDIERLLGDSGIIRNRAKIAAVIGNARALLQVSREYGSFARFVVPYRPKVKVPCASDAAIPSVMPEAEALAKDMKRQGFKFFGPTIAYAHMQAVGLVNDHITTCHRYEEIERLQRDAWRNHK
ncbi:MAG: DNA-3-methyladenine glycosylase I [Calditrichaeota bacterium]|nr:DNA-3-methyladenine glycosylase I [Calditrichota bacterium]